MYILIRQELTKSYLVNVLPHAIILSNSNQSILSKNCLILGLLSSMLRNSVTLGVPIAVILGYTKTLEHTERQVLVWMMYPHC